MLPHEQSTSSFLSSSSSTVLKQSQTVNDDEGNEVEVKLEIKEEPEEEEDEELEPPQVDEQEIFQRMSQFLNEPDECTNESDLKPELIELNYDLKEELMDESDQNPDLNEITTTTTKASSFIPFQVPADVNDNYNDREPPPPYVYVPSRYNYKSRLLTQKASFQRQPNSAYLNSRPFKCRYSGCSYATKATTNLINHMRQNHSKSPEKIKALPVQNIPTTTTFFVPSSLSSTSFSWPLAVQRQQQQQQQQPQQLELPTEAIRLYAQFVNTSHKPKPKVKSCRIFYHCANRDCDFNTQDEKQLAIHLSSEHQLPRVIVKKLPWRRDVVRRKWEVEQSSSRHHRRNRNQSTEEIMPLFKCSEPGCDYSNANRSHVRTHEFNKHGKRDNIKIFKCTYPLCFYETARSDQLKNHVQFYHVGLKNFACDLCPFKTNREANLVRHVNSVHLNLRPYKCPEIPCEYAAKTKTHLQNHMECVHLKSKLLN